MATFPIINTTIKLPQFLDDIENPKDSTKKLLELINEFSKVAGYKLNLKKSVAFLSVNKKLLEGGIEKTI